jgi:hypothetical protein
MGESMCRWNAWFGRPLVIDELLYRTPHSLIDQALHSRLGVETTNGDGFGLAQMSDEDRIVVSEPLSDLPGAWLEVSEATALSLRAPASVHRKEGGRHAA